MSSHLEHLNIDGLLQQLLFKAQEQIAGSLKLLPFILKAPLEKFLLRLNRGRFTSEQVKVQDFFLLRVNVAAKLMRRRGEEPAAIGDFALFQIDSDVWCFASAEKASTFDKILFQLLQANASLASQIFISNREYEGIFRAVAAHNFSVRVMQHSEYNREESSVTSLKERRDYRAVFKEISNKDAVIRRIRAVAYRGKGGVAMRFSVANNSNLALTAGSLETFKGLVLSTVASVGLRQSSLFSDRARHGDLLKPLRAVFAYEALGDKTQNYDLLYAIASIDKSALTVFHANPYLHCLFTDLLDGSSFNIFSSSTYSVDIVPSIRASVAALMKLYRGISEKFADCDISDAPEQAPKAEEFFGD